MENVKFYKCPICGNIVGLIDGDGKRLSCCGKPMEELTANTVDAATEKHVPVYEVNGDEMIVRVGEVSHPMEENHYIMWIALVEETKTTRVSLKPGDVPEVKFPYVKGASIYAYCNLHGLWKSEVK